MAGILLIERFDVSSRDYFDSPYVVLLIQENSGFWSEPGGTSEYFESSAETASREVQEETANLFVLPPFVLGNEKKNRVLLSSGYCAFVVVVESSTRIAFDLRLYQKNRRIIEKQKDVSSQNIEPWLETKNMTRVPLRSISNDIIQNKRDYTYDAKEIKIVLHPRTIKILKKCFRQNFFLGTSYHCLPYIPCIELKLVKWSANQKSSTTSTNKKFKFKQKKPSFLSETYSYVAEKESKQNQKPKAKNKGSK